MPYWGRTRLTSWIASAVLVFVTVALIGAPDMAYAQATPGTTPTVLPGGVLAPLTPPAPRVLPPEQPEIVPPAAPPAP
ncbi:MAG: hypothetical protein JO213_04665, partial [Alphaproteobacteria bacterium]|nr:hypothetical protein [Alphaproteobacteria bacterium]